MQHIEEHLSQLHLTLIAAAAAAQLCPSAPPSAEEADAARAYLVTYRERRGKSLDAAAQLLVDMELALLRVRKAGALARRGDGGGAAAELEAAKAQLRVGEVALSRLREGEEPCVPAAFHRASAEYYKLAGPAAACHASTMRYLGCVPAAALAPAERAALALDVALAALVGEGIYDFGEVAGQPILDALAGGPHAWLHDLLRALQEGSLAAVGSVLAAHRAPLAALPVLAAAEPVLHEKAALLALCQLVAVRPPEARRVPFVECAAACGVAVEKVRAPLPWNHGAPSSSSTPHTQLSHIPTQVEHLVMRAASVGLLKCAIDEVAQEVSFSFVKPKVLSKAQVGALKERVDAWADRVGKQVGELEGSTLEVVGQ